MEMLPFFGSLYWIFIGFNMSIWTYHDILLSLRDGHDFGARRSKIVSK